MGVCRYWPDLETNPSGESCYLMWWAFCLKIIRINYKKMFKNPFSFDGRIRRTEYGISFIIFILVTAILGSVAESNGILDLLYIPLYWFTWAQGAKRCNELGHNGW